MSATELSNLIVGLWTKSKYFSDGRRLYTKSILPGKAYFEETLWKENGEEYREFDPTHSKLAAMILKGCTNIGIRKNDVVLYLGSSHGYTVSFLSDMLSKEGLIFGIDPAPRVMRDLIFLAEKRKNIVPVLADANHPETYLDKVCQADIVYQDVSQRNQAEIFISNCDLFLKPSGYGLLSVKAKSIDVKMKPNDIFISIRKQLEQQFTVIDYRVLEPFERDHCMIIVKKK